MYLSHHYAVDLVGGGLIAAAFFYTARARWLPQRQADKLTRWEYEYVEIGNRHTVTDEEYGQYFGLNIIDNRRSSQSDDWTLGSSSSCSSSSGTLSPVTSEETIPGLLDLDSEHDSQWDHNGQRRDVELSEVVVR